MQLNSLLVNLFLTSLATARYISSDPATCSSPPIKRGLRLHGETPELDLTPVKRGLRLHDETPELDLELDARSPMGGSSIQGRGTEKEACLRCCNIGTKMCGEKCERRSKDGTGDLVSSIT
ncbi:hypothetical protein E4U60_005447 [Claviceps pazoutovae]|uniref:Secreted protein n=1 Tax=Claviceps pazoutovae TaxID=1649127 RepID=A0A9P7SIY4_9HYPO|nr:hypothetical protein E4U60_005447 [Claviceps pazoutovae]